MNHSNSAVKVNKIRIRTGGAGKGLAIGMTLMMAAVAAALYFTIGGQGSQSYWVTKVDLPVGAILTGEVVALKKLSLGDSAASYLDGAQPIENLVLTQPVAKGQLIGASQFADVADQELVSIVLQPASALASRVRVGSVVNVWTTPKAASGQFELPQLLIEEAQVFDIVKPEGVFKATMPQVELRVPEQSVPALLGAMAAEDSITLIARTDMGQQ